MSAAIAFPSTLQQRSRAVSTVRGVPLSHRIALVALYAGNGLVPALKFLHLRWSLGIPTTIADRAALLFCIPALLLGIRAFRKHGAFAKAPCFIVMISWMALSLLWVDPTERGRGLLCLTTLVIAAPIAAFVRSINGFQAGSLYFGSSFLIAMLAVQVSSPINNGRWGDFAVGDQVVMNSNEIGFISAITVILMYAIWRESATNPSGRLWMLPSILGPMACCFAAMTVSRTAGASLAIAGIGIWFHHSRRSLGMIIATPLLITLLAVGLSTLGVAERWGQRLSDAETSTLNGRTEIWDAIAAVQRRLGLNCVWGLGSGGIDKALGEELGGQVHPVDGIQRLHSHNMYLEFAVELGLVGVILLVRVCIAMFSVAMALDRHNATIWRSFLLIIIATFGLAGVPTKITCFPAIGSLLFVALSPAFKPPAVKLQKLNQRRNVA